MGRLEPEFRRLHWPPLVREAVENKDYPGYRYEFFSSFNELNKYFIELCGPDWMSEEWAIYWRNHHRETQRDDARDLKYEMGQRVTPIGRSGPRRDIKQVHTYCEKIIIGNLTISSYELVRQLKFRYDITLSQKMAWHILKKLRSQNESKG